MVEPLSLILECLQLSDPKLVGVRKFRNFSVPTSSFSTVDNNSTSSVTLFSSASDIIFLSIFSNYSQRISEKLTSIQPMF